MVQVVSENYNLIKPLLSTFNHNMFIKIYRYYSIFHLFFLAAFEMLSRVLFQSIEQARRLEFEYTLSCFPSTYLRNPFKQLHFSATGECDPCSPIYSVNIVYCEFQNPYTHITHFQLHGKPNGPLCYNCQCSVHTL